VLGHLTAAQAASSTTTSLLGFFAGQSLLGGLGFGLIIGSAEATTTTTNIANDLPKSAAAQWAGGVIWIRRIGGPALLAPFLSLAAGLLGWRSALLLEGGLCLLCGPAIMLFMRPPKNNTNTAKDDVEISPESTKPATHGGGAAVGDAQPTAATSVLLPALAAYTLTAAALAIPYGSSLQLLAGLSGHWTAACPLAVMGAAHLAGSALTAWLLNHFDLVSDSQKQVMVARAATACLSAVLLFLASCDGPRLMAALCVGLGLLSGIWAVSDPHHSLGIAPRSSTHGVRGRLAAELAPLGALPLASLTSELTGSPKAALYLAGGLAVASGLAYSLAILLGRQQKLRQK
jgi:hypothetical protein